jgi:hypothetical protein
MAEPRPLPDDAQEQPLHDPATEEVLAELSSLREWALKVCAAGEAFDRKAHAYNGADGFISGYYMPTGPWHRILGLIRSCPFDPALESEWRNPRLEGERLVEEDVWEQR